MISSCLLQDALQPVGETRGFVYGSHLHKTFWGFGGGGDTFHLQSCLKRECMTLTLRSGHACDRLDGRQEPREKGGAGPRRGVRRVR